MLDSLKCLGSVHHFRICVSILCCLISYLQCPAQATSKNPQLYNDNDSVTALSKPTALVCTGDCGSLTDKDVKKFVEQFETLDSEGLLTYLKGYKPNEAGGFNWPTSVDECQKLSKIALVVHVALWDTVSTTDDKNKVTTTITGLAYSNWRGYRSFWNGKSCSLKQPRSGDNSPLFWNVKSAKLIAIDLLQTGPVAVKDAGLVYKTSTTPTIAQNIQDLGTLIEGVTGAAKGVQKSLPALPVLLNGFLTVADIRSTSTPPYTVNVSVSIGTSKKDANAAGSKAQSGPIDCTDVASKGCTFSRQFSVEEPESWDVSIGVAIPGVTETIYSVSTTGGAPKATLKHHTDAYALFDLYPFGRLAPKQSYFPHVNFGIPLTSQSLHRPYFGIAENISLWAERKGFPLDICVFGGLVDMKQQISSPTAAGGLEWDRALKGVVGIELPISQMASKLGGKKAKAKGDSGSSQDSKSN
jgi:hypothetical protein